ncbi:MAG: Asp-tRNA(Asn)/Glu-tRNA(Gln) amidotransferase subunit GatC [Candidatus Paceibacterota bacterium]
MDIKHIAKLARIKLAEKEEGQFKKELGSILNFIDQLNKADTSGIDPAHQVHSIPQDGEPVESTTGLSNSFRSDEYRKDFLPVRQAGEINDKLNENLISQAPHRQDRFVKVKSVLNKDGK